MNGWQGEASPTMAALNAAWGSGASDVWAVGDLGTILRWDGTAWTTQTSNTVSNLRGLWGVDNKNVWAVGDNGTIVQWNGTAWTVLPKPSNTHFYHAIGGLDASNIWVVGLAGVIVRGSSNGSGSTWTAQSSGTTATLSAVWPADASNVWAAGDDLRRWNGTSWLGERSGAAQLGGVWGSDVGHRLLVGASGAILRSAPVIAR